MYEQSTDLWSAAFFATTTFTLTCMTLKFEVYLDIVKMYLHTKKEVAMLGHSSLTTMLMWNGEHLLGEN